MQLSRLVESYCFPLLYFQIQYFFLIGKKQFINHKKGPYAAKKYTGEAPEANKRENKKLPTTSTINSWEIYMKTFLVNKIIKKFSEGGLPEHLYIALELLLFLCI